MFGFRPNFDARLTTHWTIVKPVLTNQGTSVLDMREQRIRGPGLKTSVYNIKFFIFDLSNFEMVASLSLFLGSL